MLFRSTPSAFTFHDHEHPLVEHEPTVALAQPVAGAALPGPLFVPAPDVALDRAVLGDSREIPTFESSSILIRRELLDVLHAERYHIGLTCELEYLDFIVSHSSLPYPTEEGLLVALPPFATDGTPFLFPCEIHRLRQIQQFWFDKFTNDVGTQPNDYQARARRCEEAANFRARAPTSRQVCELRDVFRLGIPGQTRQIVATY